MSPLLDPSSEEKPLLETESMQTLPPPANGSGSTHGEGHSNGNGHRNGHSQSNGHRSNGPNRSNGSKSQAQSDEAKKSVTKRNPIWEIRLLPVKEIGPNPFQPRQEFDEAELEELASSVAEHGVQTPVIVRSVRHPETKPCAAKAAKAPKHGSVSTNGHLTNGQKVNGQSVEETPGAAPSGTTPLFCYELVVGERRLRACLQAGRKTIPAILRDDLSDAQAAELALIENVQRSNLNIIEEARGYKRLMLRFRFTEARLAKKVGKSIPTIQGAIKLLELPEDVQTLLLRRQLSASHGHELLRLAPHPAICTSVALKALTEKLSAASLGTTPLPNARELRRRGSVVELGYNTRFDWRRECKACPSKAFITSDHVSYCLKPDEWQKKQSHALEMEQQEAARVLEEARQQGDSSVEASELPSGPYRSLQWREPPTGCTPQCPCRGQVSDPRDGTARIPVCLDPARLEELRKAERQAQEAERERRTHALWEEAIERLCPFPVHEPERAMTVPLAYPIPATEVPEASNLETAHPAMPETAGIETAATTKLQLPSTQLTEQENPIAWSKAAPLLVLPILCGEGLPYGLRQTWEEVARHTASHLGVELPWNELMESEEEGQLLRLLEAIAPTRLLVLGAALLLRREASCAARFPAPTPLVEFVLDLQPARQTELEEPEEEAGVDSDDLETDEIEVPDENEAEDDGWAIEGLWDAEPEGGSVGSHPEDGKPLDNSVNQGGKDQGGEDQGDEDQGDEEPDFEARNVEDDQRDHEGDDSGNWSDPEEN